jgi:hypothetical protein
LGKAQGEEAMQEYGLVDQAILVAVWVGLLYGLFGLVVGWLALTDLEWRQLIMERLQQEWRGLKLRLALAWLNLSILTVRGFRWLKN